MADIPEPLTSEASLPIVSIEIPGQHVEVDQGDYENDSAIGSEE